MTSSPASPVSFREKVFEASEARINYAERPSGGPAIVFLHGIGRNWRDCLPLLPALGGWHVLALDLRGHGKSSRVRDGYRISDYASDVTAFLTNVPASPPVIFGHSLGGVIAMHIAAKHPDRVRAIIMGDSVLARDTLAHSMYQELLHGLYRVAQQGGALHTMAERLAKLEIPIPGLPGRFAIGELPGNNQASLLKWAECLQLLDPEAMRATVDGSTFQGFDPWTLLAKISCPILVLQATPDLGGLMSDKEVAKILLLQPRAQVARLQLLGHALHLQRAQPVIEALSAFLASL